MRSLLRCVPKPSRSWVGAAALAGTLGLASTGWAATGASGQGVGLEVTAHVGIPDLVHLTFADTDLQTAPPDFDKSVSTAQLASGVGIGIAQLSAGVIEASTSGTLNKNKVDSEAGLIGDSANPGLGLKVGIPSLMNILDVGATTIKSEAHGICVNGTPEFSSDTTIVDLYVNTRLGNLLSITGEEHPAPNTQLLNEEIRIPSVLPLLPPIVLGRVTLTAHDRTITNERVEVSALRLGVTLLGNLIPDVDLLNLDLKIGTSMAELDDCEAPEDGGVSISIDAPIINAGNQNAVPISGTCTPGSGDNVHITASDGASTTPDKTVSCESDGTYSTEVDASSLADGQVEFTAQQDHATDTAEVTKDATLPAVTVDPDDIDSDNQDEYPISGTCTAGDGEVTVTIGSGDNAITLTADCDENGEWETEPTDVSGQPDGEVPIQACQTDAAGNEGCGEGTANKDTSGSGNGDDDGGNGGGDDGSGDDDDGTINAIPTASQWTLILMGLLLAGLGAVRVAPGRRKFS